MCGSLMTQWGKAMTIDLSGFLRSEFDRAKLAFEEARAEGAWERARKQAQRCAELLGLLAENATSTKERTFYLEKAKLWEEETKKLARPYKRKITQKAMKEDDFTAYVEGLITTSQVKWEDIGDLEEAKQRLQEAVVIPFLKRPEAIEGWHGILLFGPPGTGKTLLAAAAAGSLRVTFFNASVTRLLSKYFGETAKIVSALFELARAKAPSLIFIDEIDALAISRDKTSGDASRRALSALLEELDGFKTKKNNQPVLTLAATNTPWDLDEALLSRFPLRIYVPLPDEKAAAQIIRIHLKGLDTSRLDLEKIAETCVERGSSGREIKYLCQEAIWHMVREENPGLTELASLPAEKLRGKILKTRPLENADFTRTLGKAKPVARLEDQEAYAQWASRYGH